MSMRMTWALEEEKMLMDRYFAARNSPALRSDKGIKTKAWTAIVAALRDQGMAVDKGARNHNVRRLDFD